MKSDFRKPKSERNPNPEFRSGGVRVSDFGFRASAFWLVAWTLICTRIASAQVTLQADGPGNTYELISSVLGGTPYEVPDCGHPEFGPHITEAWDDVLGKYVFVFHIHVTNDNDRCVNFDRQRNEIKTYGPSPASTKGFYGDLCTYRWKFKLDAGFQPSPNFTHIHQIKAGDGTDADSPLITITPRSASPERMELIYTAPAGLSGSGTKTTAPLSNFKGQWIEAYERALYASNGTYEVTLTRMSDGIVLMSYTNSNLNLWRGDATFNRPKWGIYRSLNSSNYLRDEQVLFADFSLAKGTFAPLVAHLTFDDGTANDSSGAGNNGTLINGASVIDDPIRGKVLSLDGVDDYVDLGNDGSLDLSGAGQGTIAAWVRMSNKNHNTIVSKGEWKEAYSLLIKGDSVPANLLWTGNDTSVFSGDPVPVNTWTHVAMTINGDLTTFYINGQISGATNQDRGNGIDNTAVNVCLGREQYSGSLPVGRWFFNGAMDEVMIYRVALAPSDIRQLAIASAPPIRAAITNAGDHLVLNWTGGAAPYQVQTKTNLASGTWQNEGGPLSVNSLDITPTNIAGLYRIQCQ